MKKIRPISDLRNHFAEISRDVHEHNEPIFFTKNGYGDMVVMSMEAYENMQFESEIYFKLREAEMEEQMSDVRYSTEEVMESVEELLRRYETNEV